MSTRKKNTVASALKVLAIIIIGASGLIVPLAFIRGNIGLVLVIFAAVTIVSLFVYALGEIVDLLAQIRDNTSTQAKAAPVSDELPAL